MKGSLPRGVAAALLAAVASAACSSAMGRTGAEPAISGQSTASPADLANADVGRRPHSEADAHFMSGMIPHHAQAVLIAGWAASHGASAAVQILCERMVVAQSDEIVTMQNWLRDRGEPVPDANATHLKMTMNGVEHEMLMPGMLTGEQLAQLDSAQGAEFDRLFFTFMIQHHEGALTMIDELFGSYGAAQDAMVFKLASDMFADQMTEIDRMQKMLDARSSGERIP